MDDLISRQAAIDALEKMSANYGKKGRREWHPHIEECKSELRMLPSVQPEVTEEEVKEYCRKRCLCIVDSALLKKYASAQAYVPDTNVGDIISRQAAIDAVAEIVSSMSVCLSIDECHGMKRMQGLAVRALEQLPSAQPEIIHCKDCKYYVYGDDEGESYCRNSGIGELETFYCADAERREE